MGIWADTLSPAVSAAPADQPATPRCHGRGDGGIVAR